MIPASSSSLSGGASRLIDLPMTSSAAYPYRRVAAAFQLVMMPSRVLPMTASSADSTMALNCANALSAWMRSVRSRVTQRAWMNSAPSNRAFALMRP